MQRVLITIISLLGAILGVKLFEYLGIKDKPWEDLQRKYKVANVQWIVLFFLFIAIICIFFPQYWADIRFVWFVIPAFLLIITALVDEYRPLPSWFRFVIQVVVASLIFWQWWVGFKELVLVGKVRHFPMLLSYLLTIWWFLLFVNALNWFDGINAQASLLAGLGFISIFILTKFVVIPAYAGMIKPSEMYTLNMIINIAWVLGILSVIYSILEFKPYALLRDVGVMFLGLALAWLTLLGGGKMGTILIVLSLVIFDAIWVILMRIFVYKKNPLKGDYYSHLHFRLKNIWWSKWEIRAFVLGWSLFFMILVLLQWTNKVAKIVIFLTMAILFFWLNYYLFVVKRIDKKGKMYGKEKN